MPKRLDEKTFREAAKDAETTPWWVHELVAEAKRARESEAKLVEAVKGLLFWGKPGVTFGDPGLARAEAEAALAAAGETP